MKSNSITDNHKKTVMSFVGGHDIYVYSDCVYDVSIRKYRPGKYVGTIPYSGKMLSTVISQTDEPPLLTNGIEIATKSKPVFESIDEIPSKDVCDFCVVSNLYVTACKELGIDTSRLLTIGGTVVDDNNNVIGVCFFNRN